MNNKKTILDLIITFISVIIIGTILLFLAYLIPNGRVINHIKDSANTFKQETDYIELVKGRQDTQLDNYTDSIILSLLMYDGKESFIEKSMRIYRKNYDKSRPAENLVKIIENSDEKYKITAYESIGMDI